MSGRSTESTDLPRLLLLGAAAARPEGLERALARAGFAVHEGDAVAAPEAGERAPDLLLVTLPAADASLEGFLARDGAANGHRPPRVVLLAEPSPEAVGHALALGADEVVGAEVPLAELVARLRGRLRRSRAAAEPRRAEVDPLTGCGTPAALTRRVEEEFERARRYALGFSLVLLEFEDLRALNGRQGTGAGDRLLAEAGRLLRAELRGPDFVARCGGGEFALVLPETGLNGARHAVRRARARLRTHRQPDGNDGAAEPVELRMAAGIVAYPHPAAEAPDDLLDLAEAALCRGKTAGEERVGTAI